MKHGRAVIWNVHFEKLNFTSLLIPRPFLSKRLAPQKKFINIMQMVLLFVFEGDRSIIPQFLEHQSYFMTFFDWRWTFNLYTPSFVAEGLHLCWLFEVINSNSFEQLCICWRCPWGLRWALPDGLTLLSAISASACSSSPPPSSSHILPWVFSYLLIFLD